MFDRGRLAVRSLFLQRLSSWIEGFDETNRISLELEKVDRIMLDRLMELGAEFAKDKRRS